MSTEAEREVWTCMSCRKQTLRIEAELRKFNQYRCAACGWYLTLLDQYQTEAWRKERGIGA